MTISGTEWNYSRIADIDDEVGRLRAALSEAKADEDRFWIKEEIWVLLEELAELMEE
jgi:hypothetical protein